MCTLLLDNVCEFETSFQEWYDQILASFDISVFIRDLAIFHGPLDFK
jgi:hypothetical protein